MKIRISMISSWAQTFGLVVKMSVERSYIPLAWVPIPAPLLILASCSMRQQIIVLVAGHVIPVRDLGWVLGFRLLASETMVVGMLSLPHNYFLITSNLSM